MPGLKARLKPPRGDRRISHDCSKCVPNAPTCGERPPHFCQFQHLRRGLHLCYGDQSRIVSRLLSSSYRVMQHILLTHGTGSRFGPPNLRKHCREKAFQRLTKFSTFMATSLLRVGPSRTTSSSHGGRLADRPMGSQARRPSGRTCGSGSSFGSSAFRWKASSRFDSSSAQGVRPAKAAAR